MPKYKQYVTKMIEENKNLFDSFRDICFSYSNDPGLLQEKFNLEGKKVLAVIMDYENRLCKQSEKTYSRYSGSLAEKFQLEVRKLFPLIDKIGIIEKQFSIKKINLT